MTEYRVDAYARVPYAAFIHADSLEEAWEIAEKKAKEFSIDALGSDFTMSCDDYGIEVERVEPARTYPQCPPRKFIPTYDD